MLRRAWAGEERLWKVWWLIGVPFGAACQFFSYLHIHLARGPDVAVVVLVWTFVSVFGWCIWAYTAWRCAPNVDSQTWKWVARGLIAFAPAWAFIQYGAARQDEFERQAAVIDPSQVTPDAPTQSGQSAQAQGTSQPTPDVQSTSGLTAWNDGTGRIAYLDSNWFKMTPPKVELPHSTYLYYNGQWDVALFGAVPSTLSPEEYGADFAQRLGGHESGPPSLVVVGGQSVWRVALGYFSSQPQWTGILYVFRDPRGYVWHVFAGSSYPADPGLETRANMLVAAFVKSAFAG